MEEASKTDLARLAMCIDCEGSIAIKRQQTLTNISYSISIQIGNTELKLIEWLCNTFSFTLGINKIAGFDSKIGLMYMCVLSASKASSLLKLVRPYLIIKSSKADLAIAMQETMGSKGSKPSEEVYLLRESIYLESRRLVEEKDYSKKEDLITTDSLMERVYNGSYRDEWSLLDLARLAMCIDCEGSIVLAKRFLEKEQKYSYSIAVQIGTTDTSLHEWLKVTFGFPVKLNSYTKKGKAVYISALYGERASKILKALKVFLLIKVRQADLAIALQETMGTSRVAVPEEVYTLRESIYQESRQPTKVLVTLKEGEPLFDKFNGKVKGLS